MPEDTDTVIRLWRLYPKSARELLSDPLGTAVKALQEAGAKGNIEELKIAIDLLSFIASENTPE